MVKKNIQKTQMKHILEVSLGRMLFSGDEALKTVNVLSGGEKVRCVLAKLMLSGANFLSFDGTNKPPRHGSNNSIK